MSEMANKLRDYCRDVVKGNGRSGRDWAYGAVSFAYINGLITSKERSDLLDQFRLLE